MLLASSLGGSPMATVFVLLTPGTAIAAIPVATLPKALLVDGLYRFYLLLLNSFDRKVTSAEVLEKSVAEKCCTDVKQPSFSTPCLTKPALFNNSRKHFSEISFQHVSTTLRDQTTQGLHSGEGLHCKTHVCEFSFTLSQ